MFVWSPGSGSDLIDLEPRRYAPPAAEPDGGRRASILPGGVFAVDAELKRDARSVIDRIVHLRDSL